jgi:hypothetical protein
MMLGLAFPLKWARKSFLRFGCQCLILDVTFMSAGPEFVGVDGWGRLPGWHGPASSKPGAEKIKTKLMLSIPMFLRLTQVCAGKKTVPPACTSCPK